MVSRLWRLTFPGLSVFANAGWNDYGSFSPSFLTKGFVEPLAAVALDSQLNVCSLHHQVDLQKKKNQYPGGASWWDFKISAEASKVG